MENKRRLLIVDDDPLIRQLLKRIVENDEISTQEAETGQQALEALKKEPFDLVLLDITLTGRLDGFDVLKAIRASRTDTPVMIISGDQEDYTAVYGYNLGADDFVTKPIKPVILRAKIQTMLRRFGSTGHSKKEPELHCGAFRYNPMTHTFYKHDDELALTYREAKLFQFFMEHPRQVFTKEQLYINIWDDSLVDDNTVMVYVSRLRNKLAPAGNKDKYIQTVWGIGYQFIPDEE